MQNLGGKQSELENREFELAILTIVVSLDGVINDSVPEPPSTKTRNRGVFKIHVKYGHVGIRSLR